MIMRAIRKIDLLVISIIPYNVSALSLRGCAHGLGQLSGAGCVVTRIFLPA